MKYEEFKNGMDAYRRTVDDEAKSLKDSFSVVLKLSAMYRKLDNEERNFADRVLAEWVLSKDECLRFDALALIDDFKVLESLPALEELAKRLYSSCTPGAPYELQKVNRIIKKFSS